MIKEVNMVRIMVPKVALTVLHDDETVRQGLEIMRRNGYTAVPVLDSEEHYLGSVTEGDFLRHVLETKSCDMKVHEDYFIRDIFRRDYCRPLSIMAHLEDLIKATQEQNFVPIVDDRNILCGIVTRKALISYLAKCNDLSCWE